MKYQIKVQVTPEFLTKTNLDDADEYIKKELVRGIVTDMKLEDLEKIFTFEKYDPDDLSESGRDKFLSLDKDEQIHLSHSTLILFKCSIEIT